MSEAAAPEGEVTESEVKIEAKKEEAPRPSREDYSKKQEEKARKDGWVDFDEFVDAGKDPAHWRPAEAYNLFKDFKGTLTRKEQEFSQRIQGVQQLAQAQLQAQREELTQKRDAAIEQGQLKEVHSLDKQINNLNQPIVQPSPDPFLSEWNANNQWIFEDSPKADRAYKVFNTAINSGKNPQQAVAAVEADIAKHFPSASRQPVTIPESERGKPSVGFGKTQKALSMNDLNDDERLAWKAMGQSAWGGDTKVFLQAVQDSRTAAKGGK